ncbi:hypothetical protein RE628_11470 [Paenibacillus sp. D2_2]|uniref:hypothetical protein n=1 Tax=Paenibacillus sp. D2_2 TaxID=3073092 RepID=UPI002815ECAC|nr:hypothetical protein [Paenibacillus sp. D2_2]WMT42845.1 hypothetical protein RE628_11470 [Paenibacillus sp. D2_2]
MAKVILEFKERFHDYKRYKTGDEYPEEDKERVSYLVKAGFLTVEQTEDEHKPRQRKKRGVNSDGDSNT